MKIPFTKTFLESEEISAVARTIHSGWVTQGPEVEAFEQEFANFVGAPYASAVSSCTAALHLALRAAGVGSGDEVITVSHSFIATANAIRYCGAKAVFVDIEPGTFNIAPGLLERVVSSRTKAILCVHQMGMPCDLRMIVDVGLKAGIPVVEDAACAIGSEILWQDHWEKIGRPHGDVACFSFHPRKLLTTGDGGMITTSHPDWDMKFKLWRHHGMDIPDSIRHKEQRIVFEQYKDLGYNYRLTDIQAAVGREQLKRIPAFVKQRRKLGNRYMNLLAAISGLGLPLESEWAHSNWQSFCVRLPQERRQPEVMKFLLDRGVSTRRGVMNAHEEEAYGPDDWSCGCSKEDCHCPPRSCRLLVHSERAKNECIILPLYHVMTEAEQNYVVKTLAEALI